MAGLTYPQISYGEILSRPASLYPGREAVVFQDTRLTFGDLDRRVNALAHALRRLGIGRGDRVSLFMTNRPEYVVSFFALARLGAVPTPMNPSYREREVAYQLADTEAVAVIVQRDLVPLVRAVRRETPRLGHMIAVGPGALAEADALGLDDLVATAPTTPPPAPDLRRNDLLVLPYSSGTTGLPKGVLLSHQAFVCNNIQFIAASQTTGDDRVLIFVPLYHIYGLMLMGGGLYAGACLVLMERFDPLECLRLVETERVTMVPVVPPVLTALLQHPRTARVSWRSVRYVMVGAAPVAPELSRRFRELTGVKVVQGYGLTEAGPITHMNPVHDDRLLTLDTAGRPVPDCEQKIVDLESGERELPIGEVGEICVRSPGLMLGYWNAPEATAAALRDGWLHTGDIGRIDERGYVTVTDRKKEMIKYKGFGIAPAEIEALLFEHPGVADVAVIGKPDPEAGEVPKAFVVRQDRALTAEALLGWARGRLAGYKTLHEVEFVEAIPKTASGKILRRVLTEQERRVR
ncbi:MAG TPA: long-chain-fatty-acid--CoA ligase [Methylomirabilota bacterium]|nr:long-chain-fatty-acid--CoA ligase [Methylomirabilota bacterium]